MDLYPAMLSPSFLLEPFYEEEEITKYDLLRLTNRSL